MSITFENSKNLSLSFVGICQTASVLLVCRFSSKTLYGELDRRTSIINREEVYGNTQNHMASYMRHRWHLFRNPSRKASAYDVHHR